MACTFYDGLTADNGHEYNNKNHICKCCVTSLSICRCAPLHFTSCFTITHQQHAVVHHRLGHGWFPMDYALLPPLFPLSRYQTHPILYNQRRLPERDALPLLWTVKMVVALVVCRPLMCLVLLRIHVENTSDCSLRSQ
jgi:hypothetical protein